MVTKSSSSEASPSSRVTVRTTAAVPLGRVRLKQNRVPAFDFDPTKPRKRVEAIVLVSNEAAQVAACRCCAEALEVYFRYCPVESAATHAARWLPFALVVDELLYDFSPREFDNLATDVRATLITIAERADPRRLVRDLEPVLTLSQRRHQRSRR